MKVTHFSFSLEDKIYFYSYPALLCYTTFVNKNVKIKDVKAVIKILFVCHGSISSIENSL